MSFKKVAHVQKNRLGLWVVKLIDTDIFTTNIEQQAESVANAINDAYHMGFGDASYGSRSKPLNHQGI